MANGFGTFDFALTDGVGSPSPGIVMPGQSVTFVLGITGTGPFAPSDFADLSSNGYMFAAKFVNGPPDPENPGHEDSAFGAIAVPEPASAGLLALGLLGLAAARRRR